MSGKELIKFAQKSNVLTRTCPIGMMASNHIVRSMKKNNLDT